MRLLAARCTLEQKALATPGRIADIVAVQVGLKPSVGAGYLHEAISSSSVVVVHGSSPP